MRLRRTGGTKRSIAKQKYNESIQDIKEYITSFFLPIMHFICFIHILNNNSSIKGYSVSDLFFFFMHSYSHLKALLLHDITLPFTLISLILSSFSALSRSTRPLLVIIMGLACSVWRTCINIWEHLNPLGCLRERGEHFFNSVESACGKRLSSAK